MRICLTLLLLSLLSFNVLSQGHWHLKHSAGVEWNELKFVDTLVGYAFGDALDATGQYSGPVIIKTTDGGDTWLDVTPVAPESRFWAAWFLDAQYGFAVGRFGGGGTIAKTTDGGVTWTVQPGIASERLLGVAFVDANTGFVCAKDGFMLRTTDGGDTWHPYSTGFNDDLNAIFFFDNGKGFIAGDDGYLAMTLNDGSTWTTVNTPTQNELTAIFFRNANEGWISTEAGEVLRTTDGGLTWTLHNTGQFVELLDVAAVSPTKAWSAGDFGTLVTTNDGQTWSNDTMLSDNSINALEAKGPYAWLADENGNIFKWTAQGGSGNPTPVEGVRRGWPMSCYVEGNMLVVTDLPAGASQLQVYNILGQLLQTTPVTAADLRIPLRQPAGLYFITVIDRSNRRLATAKAKK